VIPALLAQNLQKTVVLYHGTFGATCERMPNICYEPPIRSEGALRACPECCVTSVVVPVMSSTAICSGLPNLGKDPVATIDNLLRERLDGLVNGGGPHDLIAKMAERAGEIEKGLKTGDYKRCKKCDRDLPVEMFRDTSAKSGLGRYCRECKTAGSKSHKTRFRRYYRR
jgi:hypothetical protein